MVTARASHRLVRRSVLHCVDVTGHLPGGPRRSAVWSARVETRAAASSVTALSRALTSGRVARASTAASAGTGLLAVFAVVISVIGIRGIGSFPSGTGQARGVIGLAALLVLFAAASAIITA